MNNSPIPRWIHWLVLLVVLGQLGAIAMLLSGRLHGPQRNLVPEALLGGAMALFVLAAYLVRFHSASFRPAPARLGIVAITVLALGLCGLYFVRNRAVLTLPYDLGGWSESFFMTDVIKWRTGTPLYTSPDDSNSGAYTPGTPAVSYFLARMAGLSDSIRTYRFLLQAYLAFAALFAGAAAWNLLRIADPETFPRTTRLWLPFFIFTSFLIATNSETNAFNIFLHNDPLSVLISTIAFWTLTQFSVSRNPRWLAAMAVLPALGFLVKQYLAIFAVMYVVYLWLDGESSLRRIVVFGAATFAILGAAAAAGLLIWGDAYRYWVFEIMGSHVVSFVKINERFADAGLFILLGLIGGLILLRGARTHRLIALWAGWLVMTFGGLYTSGVTFLPAHLGPSTMVGACFALAALATLRPLGDVAESPPAQQWFQVVVGFLAVLTVFAAMGFTRVLQLTVDPDLHRYVRDIEHEFEGLPADRVLLDAGEWIYLHNNVVMKDRMAMLNTHRTPHYGLLGRLDRQEYSRILVHVLPTGNYAYDMGRNRGIQKDMARSYREVRRIPGIRGMEGWLNYEMSMSDIAVLEPISRANAAASGPASAAQGGRK